MQEKPGVWWVWRAMPSLIVCALADMAAGGSMSTATVRFYHPDHLGSTNITTDESGAAVSETVYYPFGSIRHMHPGQKTEGDENYHFGGKERDEESGLQYFEARFLTSEVGRFVSVDPLYSGDPAQSLSNPQLANLYSYTLNNPLNRVDPTGMDPVDLPPGSIDLVGAAKVIVAGALYLAVEAFGGSNTANAPESASAPTQDSQTTGEVAFRVATNVGFTKVVGTIARGIIATEQIAATPFIRSATTAESAGEWVPVKIGEPIPGVKAPPINNPRLAAALKSYTPSTPAQQLANKGQTLLVEHMTFGARRPAGTLLNMAQAGERAQIGQLHQYFIGQHQQAVQAAAQTGASKPMLDSLKNLADMTVPLSGK